MSRTSQRGKIRWDPTTCVSLAVAVGSDIVVDVVLMVRFKEGEEQVEWFLFVYVDVPYRRVGQCIHAVAGEFDGIALVVVHDGIVRLGGKLEKVRPEPVLVPSLLMLRDWVLIRKVPLADVSRAVTRLAKMVGQCLSLWWECEAIAVDAGLRRI